LISGVSELVKIIISISRPHGLYLSLGILGIPICFGLLRHSGWWRSVSLFMIWIALIVSPIIYFIGVFAAPITYFEVLWMQFNVPRVLFVLLAALSYALIVWQYRVLTEDSIARLFVAER